MRRRTAWRRTPRRQRTRTKRKKRTRYASIEDAKGMEQLKENAYRFWLDLAITIHNPRQYCVGILMKLIAFWY